MVKALANLAVLVHGVTKSPLCVRAINKVVTSTLRKKAQI